MCAYRKTWDKKLFEDQKRDPFMRNTKILFLRTTQTSSKMNLLIYSIEMVRKFVVEKLRVNIRCRHNMSVRTTRLVVRCADAYANKFILILS